MNFRDFPNFKLHHVPGGISSRFLDAGLQDFHRALEYVWSLPYRRISDPSNCNLVLAEGCGTCSSKHAAIAKLASEHSLKISLIVGIFEMNKKNTPGVAEVLQRHGLEFLPEAHCFLRWEGKTLDLTCCEESKADELPKTFLYEEEIKPSQVGDYKAHVHKRFLTNWLQQLEHPVSMTLDQLWRIREECISALTEI